jgi:hypothetical protein
MKPIYSSLLAVALIAGFAPALHSAESGNKYAPLTYTPMSTYGQALVDMEVAAHPELKILTLHVTPPGIAVDVDKERRLMFSNIGRIGKVDDPVGAKIFRSDTDDIVIKKEAPPPSTNFSITAAPKYEVGTQLKDASGKPIGLAVMVFPYHENFDLEVYHRIAQSVAADLSSRVKSKDDLFRPASE